MATRLARSKLFSRHLCRSRSAVTYNPTIHCLKTREFNMSSAMQACLSMDNINPCIKTMEYAVRYEEEITQK